MNRVLPLSFCLLAPLPPILAQNNTPALPQVPAALESLKPQISRAQGDLLVSLKSATPLSSEQWDALVSLKPRRLNFHSNALDDSGVDRLIEINPVGLGLDQSPLTGKGVAKFAALKSLVHLSTNHTVRPTPEAAAAFAAHPALQSFSTIGAFCIEALQAPNLKTVVLQHSASCNAHAALLANHPSIESLSLGQWGGATLDDGGLPPIATLKKLKVLRIFLADLTYAGGLQHLKGLASLTTLDLVEVNLPPGDLEKLQADLPKVKITHSPMSEASRARRDALLKKSPAK
jgi:hypothetical protein